MTGVCAEIKMNGGNLQAAIFLKVSWRQSLSEIVCMLSSAERSKRQNGRDGETHVG